jgi:hypothetical protein
MLREFQAGFSLTPLPQTMKDAVITTGKLGFRYLRIDSLCIMQDDAADKAKEISKMGTVYKNLLSLLLCRVQDWHLMVSLSSKQHCHLPSPILPHRRIGWELVAGSMEFHRRPPTLNRRAWTLQESLLSPRTGWWISKRR